MLANDASIGYYFEWLFSAVFMGVGMDYSLEGRGMSIRPAGVVTCRVAGVTVEIALV